MTIFISILLNHIIRLLKKDIAEGHHQDRDENDLGDDTHIHEGKKHNGRYAEK